MARGIETAESGGPLTGLKVVEFAGLGPGPFCAMLLSDLGADVVRIHRPGIVRERTDVLTRGRTHLSADLKNPRDRDRVMELLAVAEVCIEGFRPGVMERLGFGPEPVLERNPAIVYGRMTGWGQSGPLAHSPGHDINYIAISGALHAIGTEQTPVAPLNLVGDYGGGALYLAFGLVSAVLHARATGAGQVVDCAMTDGSASLMSFFYGLYAAGRWRDTRAANFADGGAHYYGVYQCADGRWLAVGAIEAQFYGELIRLTGCDAGDVESQNDERTWPHSREALAAVFRTRSRDAWCELLEGSSACVAPVLSMGEAPLHRQNLARGTFTIADGVLQPAPAPRFSATPGRIQGSAQEGDGASILRKWTASANR